LHSTGAGWRAIADELHLGTETDARKCVALLLSADLKSRRTAAGEGTGKGGDPSVMDCGQKFATVHHAIPAVLNDVDKSYILPAGYERSGS
jgi:hypothetical protein